MKNTERVLNSLIKSLARKGLKDVEIVNLKDNKYNAGIGLIVRHNYDGLYPTEETFKQIHAVRKAAGKRGFVCEDRGCKTSTLVYITE